MDEVLGKFKGGVSSFQGLLDDLVSALEKEREELKKARDQLESEKKAFVEEAQRVQHVLSDSEQVTLNVGGAKFTTTVSTLRNAPSPSLFAAMFSGRHPLKKDDAGCFFIDRDGRHFHDVLNFLRDGQFNYPSGEKFDQKYLIELRAEAEYYGLCGLVSQIDRHPYNITTVHRAASMNCEDSWMYEDGQDEIVFTVDRQCQLLGVGLCGTEIGYTAEVEILEVDPEDFLLTTCTLQVAAQSFTKADGQICQLFLPSAVPLHPGKYYMISALIKGSESYCCEECLEIVIAGGVRVQFQVHESNNGTNESRGQFPEFYIRLV